MGQGTYGAHTGLSIGVKMMSLQENLGRKDLDWLEIARGYQALQEEGLTQEQIAGLMGVDRTAVTHRLRLLELPEEVKNVSRLTFSEGHAVTLLGLETPRSRLRLSDIFTGALKWVAPCY